jgi:hypothetical protein
MRNVSGKARVRAHRERLRRSGLRPLQIWVADTRRKGFAAAVRRQVQAVASSDGERDDLALLASLADARTW